VAVNAHATATPQASIELAVVDRSGFVESRHLGSAAVVAADGQTLAALGDVASPVLAGAALAPVQAMTAVSMVPDLADEQVAIAAGRHVGTPGHVALVRDLLARAELSDAALGCPAAWPEDQASRDALVRAGEPAARVYMERSGTHAALLAASALHGLPLAEYLLPDHAVQVSVRETIERLSAQRPGIVTVDACGSPTWTVSLDGLARSFARIRTASATSPFALYRSAARVTASMLSAPWALAGPARPVSIVTGELGVLAASSGEGVLVMAGPDGTTVAIKCLDGAERATTLVGLQLLVAAGSIEVDAVQRVVPRLGLEVLGGGRPVGAVRVGADVPTRLTQPGEFAGA